MLESPPEMVRKQVDPYLAAFDRHLELAAARHPSWLLPLRKAGMARFAELGFPKTKDEDWRFTNVTPIAQLPFVPVGAAGSGRVTAGWLAGTPLVGLPASRLVFVDGQYAPELSALRPLPEGVRVSRLAEALADDGALLEKHLGRLLRTDDNAFGALNTAFFTDGLFVSVPEGVQVPDPVHVVYVGSASEAGSTSMPRNLVWVGARAGVTILESHVSVGDGRRWTNAATDSQKYVRPSRP